MIKNIIFDDLCAHWSKNYMYNKSFIEQQIRYIFDIIRCRGYIYLDRIYELFGAGWNPYDRNDCIIYDENDLVITYKNLKDSDFKITICY